MSAPGGPDLMVLCADEAYAMPLAVTVRSLVDNIANALCKLTLLLLGGVVLTGPDAAAARLGEKRGSRVEPGHDAAGSREPPRPPTSIPPLLRTRCASRCRRWCSWLHCAEPRGRVTLVCMTQLTASLPHPGPRLPNALRYLAISAVPQALLLGTALAELRLATANPLMYTFDFFATFGLGFLVPMLLALVVLPLTVGAVRFWSDRQDGSGTNLTRAVLVTAAARIALLVPVAYGLVQLIRTLAWAVLAYPTALGRILAGTLALTAVLLAPVWLLGLRRWGGWECRRAAALLREPAPEALAPLAGGPLARIRQAMGDRATWRAVCWLPAYTVVGGASSTLGAGLLVLFADGLRGLIHFDGRMYTSYVLDVVGPRQFATNVHDSVSHWLVVCLGEMVVAAVGFWFLAPWLASWQARMNLLLLAPSDAGQQVSALARRVDELATTRAGAIDAHTAELRRIERDLHDGTQAHLVNLTMRLGMVERRLADDPRAVATLVREARDCAEDAMAELRDVLRTMYPPVLADRGLRGALTGLAGRCPVPTTVEVALGAVPAPIEAAAYFIAAEALTNAAKHSAATHADVSVRMDEAKVLVEVTDNGLGGADEARGTGIVGMHRRAAALDGWVEVTSPAGGPTAVIAELPCGS